MCSSQYCLVRQFEENYNYQSRYQLSSKFRNLVLLIFSTFVFFQLCRFNSISSIGKKQFFWFFCIWFSCRQKPKMPIGSRIPTFPLKKFIRLTSYDFPLLPKFSVPGKISFFRVISGSEFNFCFILTLKISIIAIYQTISIKK